MIEYVYIIPKNSNIEINIAYMLSKIGGIDNNGCIRSDINMNRWLKKDLISKESKEYLIPFGVGGRQCPGQTLSRKELYAIFANLLLKYKVLRNGNEPINIKFTFGELTRRISPPIAVKIAKR